MKLLVFDYHYIDEEEKYSGGIYPVSLKRLEKQLDEVGMHFQFISQSDLVDAVAGTKKLPDMSCLVTFDDGLRNQYERALPILKRKGIPALFFVSSLPYLEKKTCLVHKIHWLRAHIPSVEILALLEKYLKEMFGKTLGDIYDAEHLKGAMQKYRYDTPEDAKVKFFLNNVLENHERKAIVEKIFSGIVSDEASFTESFYATEEHIREYYDLGMLGLHSYDHTALNTMNPEEIRTNLEKNKAHLEGLVQGEVYSLSYPYGSRYDINEGVIRASTELGIRLGFTKERAFNASLAHPLLFARFDTNDVLGGKKPGFQIEKNNLHLQPGFSEKRTLWIQE